MPLVQVMLYAKDLAAMVAFYRDAIGLRVVEEREGWVALDAGAARFALHAIAPAIAAGIAITRPPQRRSETPYKLTFDVGALDAARARIATHGGVPGDAPADATSCEALDPEGNVLVLRGR